MRMSFPGYFIVSTLQSMGWPRKKSFLGSMGVPGSLYYATWIEMVKSAVGLGVGKPHRACQLITDIFSNRDWDVQSADAFFAEFCPLVMKKIQKREDDLPWQAIVKDDLIANPPDFIKWKDLFDEKMGVTRILNCVSGLVYGLAYPADAGNALEKDREQYKSTAAWFNSAGGSLPERPAFSDNESYFSWLDEILLTYEKGSGSLPQPAPQLLKAKVIRARRQ